MGCSQANRLSSNQDASSCRSSSPRSQERLMLASTSSRSPWLLIAASLLALPAASSRSLDLHLAGG
eukprot:761909-Hanusia_phi.AAC.5